MLHSAILEANILLYSGVSKKNKVDLPFSIGVIKEYSLSLSLNIILLDYFFVGSYLELVLGTCGSLVCGTMTIPAR